MEFSPTSPTREGMMSGQPMTPMSSHTGVPTAPRKEEKNIMKKMLPKIVSTKTLVVLILALQILTAVFVLPFSPLYIFKQETLANRIVDEVSRITAVNINEQPQVAVVADPDTLRNANDIQGQVYKDVQKGDYVIVYSDRMFIYRRNDNKLIYEGDTPAALANKSQQALVTAITNKAKEAKLISNDSTETPQLSAVTDASVVKTQDPTFYADVAKDDVIALFPNAKVVILFRPSTGNMINSGSFSTSIAPKQ